MSTIKNEDLFITDRSNSNYRVPAEDLRAFVGVLEPGTRVLFNNPSAPLGWVNLADSNTNSTTLRIVKTGGGVTGGSGAFNTAYGTHTIKASKHKHAVGESNHSHTGTMASHGHGVTDPGHSHTMTMVRSVEQELTDDGGFSMSSTGDGDIASSMNTASMGVGSAKTGITLGSNGATWTSGNNNALNISVNNAGSTVSWDFRIKYNDFIICQKSP